MDGQLALVTGAGRGYGAVVARHLAAAGAKVAVLGRDPTAVGSVADETGGIPVVADVLDRPGLDVELAALVEQHGPVDVLVNNAGVGGPLGLAWEVDQDDWWRTVEVNVRGAHHVTSVLLPAMIAAGHGRIVNIASHAGTARWPYGSAYSVSKAALIKLGENLAAEVRRHGIVVLSFHPGILEVGLTDSLFAADPPPGTVGGMVADWFRTQIAEGRSIDADVSAQQLVRIARGDLDGLSGRYVTAYDDLDELLGRSDEITASNVYTLGLIQP